MEKSKTIYNLQMMRFFAAAMVVLAHTELSQYNTTTGNGFLGGFGVDIFFIISGFIIPYVAYGGSKSEGSFRMSPVNFFMRRVIRIIPIYAIITALCVLSAYIVNHMSNPTAAISYWWPASKIDFQWYIESITFTHWHRPAILSIGWTLQYEFLFYTCFSLFMAMKLSKIEYIDIAFVTIIVFVNALTYHHVTNTLVKEYALFIDVMSQPIMVEFALGMFMYRMYISGVMLKKNVALVILFAFIPVFYICESMWFTREMGGAWHRPLVYGFFAFYGVWSALSLEGKIKAPRILTFLGDASYSIYLMHGLTTAWVSYIFVATGAIAYTNIIVYIVFYFIISCALGALAHVYIEKPIAKMLKRYI